jgi:hypothetical protein
LVLIGRYSTPFGSNRTCMCPTAPPQDPTSIQTGPPQTERVRLGTNRPTSKRMGPPRDRLGPFSAFLDYFKNLCGEVEEMGDLSKVDFECLMERKAQLKTGTAGEKGTAEIAKRLLVQQARPSASRAAFASCQDSRPCALHFPVTCNPSRAVTLPMIGDSQYIRVPRRVVCPYISVPRTQ